ncbi:hypothetical protein KY289_006094 [Solanum tuberosum]|nr:hypothetical protein KY289_006094 [Solanum tuberosum]
MEHVVNPGPTDRTLLLSQHKHKSELLWKSEISFSSLMRTYDRAFVITMIERWRPETHCFHLPFREDVAQRIHPCRTLLETLTRCAIAPADMDGASRVRIHNITGYLRDQLQVDPIRDVIPVERIEKISRLYILVILGGILFSNTSGYLISL